MSNIRMARKSSPMKPRVIAPTLIAFSELVITSSKPVSISTRESEKQETVKFQSRRRKKK